jgi:hypothetical protein
LARGFANVAVPRVGPQPLRVRPPGALWRNGKPPCAKSNGVAALPAAGLFQRHSRCKRDLMLSVRLKTALTCLAR